MNVLKRRIVDAHVEQIGSHDDPAIYAGPAGDPGLVGPGSMSWEIHGDVAAVAIAGIGAIVLEILHPSVMAGVQDRSNYREQPVRRARNTYGYVVTTTFGSTEAAERLIARVRRMHEQVHGTRPDGVAYRAMDPELIGWVHTCIPFAILRAFERYNRPLTEAERDRYLREQAVIGRLGGAGDIPETAGELRDYVEAMRPQLTVNEQTRAFFDFLLGSTPEQPEPGALTQRLARYQVEGAMGIMPRWVRHLTGFEHSALAHRALYDPPLRLYATQLRWAFGTPPYKAMAEARTASSRPARPELVAS